MCELVKPVHRALGAQEDVGFCDNKVITSQPGCSCGASADCWNLADQNKHLTLNQALGPCSLHALLLPMPKRILNLVP